MARAARRKRARPDDDSPPAGADAAEWESFLADVGAAEQVDQDEPEQWGRFFERVCRALGLNTPAH